MGVVWYQLCAWTSPEVGHQLDCVCWWITWNAQCRLKQWLNSDHLSYYSLMSRNTCNQDLGYFILPVHTTDCNFPLSSVGIACGKVRIWVRGDFVMSIIKSMNFTDVHFWTYLYQQTDLVTPQLHWISGGKLGHLSVSSWYHCCWFLWLKFPVRISIKSGKHHHIVTLSFVCVSVTYLSWTVMKLQIGQVCVTVLLLQTYFTSQ